MRNRAIIAMTLLVGLPACAPTLESNGRSGGTVHQVQLWPNWDQYETRTMAQAYCGQFGGSAHIAREEIGWFRSESITFDCIP
jgi:hypothetical protein